MAKEMDTLKDLKKALDLFLSVQDLQGKFTSLTNEIEPLNKKKLDLSLEVEILGKAKETAKSDLEIEKANILKDIQDREARSIEKERLADSRNVESAVRQTVMENKIAEANESKIKADALIQEYTGKVKEITEKRDKVLEAARG